MHFDGYISIKVDYSPKNNNQGKAVLEDVDSQILEKRRPQVLYRQFQKSFATLTEPLESFSKDVWFTLLNHVTVNSPTDVKYTLRDGSVI